MRRVLREGAFADRALRAEAARASLEPRERAFCQRLAYGTVQRLLTLDHVIEAVSERPVGRIDPPLLDALRLGAFELLHMDGVPDRAAVEQAVELAKLAHGRGSGFANAVMRRAAREARTIVGRLTDASPEEAAIRHSHPEWIVRLWWEALGAEETRLLLARDNQPPESAVRVNELLVTAHELRLALAAGGVPARPAPGLPEGLLVAAFDAASSPLFDAGALTPQSRASMLPARALRPRPGERVLDLCAAPGAKTTQLAALMEGRGELIALERHTGRAEELRRNCERMGASFVDVRCADARAPVAERFDRALVDAPCSDLGTLQRRPDARWRKRPEDVDSLAALQAELLEAAARQLRPGGTVVFSTCTISPRENEQQVDRFMSSHADFTLDDLGAEQPPLRHPAAPRCLLALPHRHGSDGFFVARLRRRA